MNTTRKAASSSASAGGKETLVLCAATVLKADFKTRVKAARSAGYQAISLFPQQYLNARHREKLSVADMRAILKANDIRVATIDPLLDWFGPAESFAETLIYEAAEAVEASSINLAPAFAPDISQQQLIEHFSAVCQRAAKRGLNVDLEVLPWSVVSSYPALFEIVLASGQANAFITFDCLHFYRSGGTVADLVALGPDKLQRISNVQLCDIGEQPAPMSWRQGLAANVTYMANGWDGVRTMGFKAMVDVAAKAHTTRGDATVLMKEAICARLLPGQGVIPLTEIIQTLKDMDCQPLIGMEIYSLAMNKLNAEAAAQQAMRAYRRLSNY